MHQNFQQINNFLISLRYIYNKNLDKYPLYVNFIKMINRKSNKSIKLKEN